MKLRHLGGASFPIHHPRILRILSFCHEVVLAENRNDLKKIVSTRLRKERANERTNERSGLWGQMKLLLLRPLSCAFFFFSSFVVFLPPYLQIHSGVISKPWSWLSWRHQRVAELNWVPFETRNIINPSQRCKRGVVVVIVVSETLAVSPSRALRFDFTLEIVKLDHLTYS
jgi:hypothetical protein